jgi:2-succinyl-5-enolpyruvyl-6-hydroxy-3-cyclohexene-1-carboxylate synthase
MNRYYTDEKHVQVLIYLLKQHGVRKVVASPGATNVSFVISVQNDPYFQVYSSVDERSAAYIACGMSAESCEPVVLTCTGATAARNYFSGLTEAYYRKLPILAVTSTQPVSRVGHLIAQVTDRSVKLNDLVKISVALPIIKDDEDLWDVEIKANRAILELWRAGGGPSHINLPTSYCMSFDTKILPKYRVIRRIYGESEFPKLVNQKIAIFVGSHQQWNKELELAVDTFCSKYNAVLLCDHTSAYRGKYRVLNALSGGQVMPGENGLQPDLAIHIGEISGDYYGMRFGAKNVWRVSPDGELRDTFRHLSHVFQMSEVAFFKYYSEKSKSISNNSYLHQWLNHIAGLRQLIPSDIPFSNIWAAGKIAPLLPENSVVHLAILNSLRSWNFFEMPETVSCASNVGGFGIDGCISSLLGASLVHADRLYFGIVGDLAFFYDMNVLGNRHIGSNIRILLVNNGKGTEFRQYGHPASALGDEADVYVAASGHFGMQSPTLVQNYAQDLGFEYMSASSKTDFEKLVSRFVSPEKYAKPIVFEIFTNSTEEYNALEIILNIEKSLVGMAKGVAKQLLGADAISSLKRIAGR